MWDFLPFFLGFLAFSRAFFFIHDIHYTTAMQSKETHLTLYRKYRPQKFSEVLGQEHIAKVLEASIKNGKVAHAYIFAGTRGTGKTSTARIFGKALNISANDTYEIDAASNRGIDEIRALREAVHTMPYESPYKLYILDEAHMLTKDAWNALLKTIEEPPSHVLFIFATTEAEKIPETIHSRCETYVFKKPTREVLKKVLTDIAKKEGYTLPAASAELITLLAEGSFRDAESVLQKVISASKDKTIDPEEVELVTGAPKAALLNQFLQALDAKNAATALAALAKAVVQGTDMKTFGKLLLERMRAVLLLRFAKDMEATLAEEYTEADFEVLQTISKNAGSAVNASCLLEFLNAYEMVAYAAIPSLPLELAVIKVTG